MSTGQRVVLAPADSPRWLKLAQRARLLSWVTLGWLGIEAAAGVAAAIIAGAAALLGFGLDSGIEALASIIVIWRFTGSPGRCPSGGHNNWSPSASGCSRPISPSRQYWASYPVTGPRPAGPGSR